MVHLQLTSGDEPLHVDTQGVTLRYGPRRLRVSDDDDDERRYAFSGLLGCLKCTSVRGSGSAPNTTGGAYRAPPPGPLACKEGLATPSPIIPPSPRRAVPRQIPGSTYDRGRLRSFSPTNEHYFIMLFIIRSRWLFTVSIHKSLFV